MVNKLVAVKDKIILGGKGLHVTTGTPMSLDNTGLPSRITGVQYERLIKDLAAIISFRSRSKLMSEVDVILGNNLLMMLVLCRDSQHSRFIILR